MTSFVLFFFSRWLSSCSVRKAWHPLPLYWAYPHTHALGSSFHANCCLFVYVGELCGEDISEDGLFHVCMSRLLRAKMLFHLALSAIWKRIPNSQWKYLTKKPFLFFKKKKKLEVIYIRESVHYLFFWLRIILIDFFFFWDRFLMCQPDLKLMILLLLPTDCWAHRWTPPQVSDSWIISIAIFIITSSWFWFCC